MRLQVQSGRDGIMTMTGKGGEEMNSANALRPEKDFPPSAPATMVVSCAPSTPASGARAGCDALVPVVAMEPPHAPVANIPKVKARAALIPSLP